MPDSRIRVHELASCASTQDELRALAEAGAPAFTAVRADVQIAGRGRRGRRWEAPAGTALLVSILLRPVRARRTSSGSQPRRRRRRRRVRAHVRRRRPAELAERRRLRRAQARRGARRARARCSVLLGVGMNLSSGAADLPARRSPRADVAAARDRICSRRARGADGAARRPCGRWRQLFDAEGPAAIAARARPLDALGAPRWSCGSRAARSSRARAAGNRRRRQPPRARAAGDVAPTRAARSCA